MRTLLIDNYDSYTYNLFQLVAQVVGTPPVVVTNDDVRWKDLAADDFEAIIISPGPGHPECERDLGVVRDIIAGTAVPLLGVCLGHQAIAQIAGGAVVAAPRPRHGHLTRVRHDGQELFDGVPQDFVAVRYHSLCVPADRLPPTIEPTAWAEDDVVMALRHRERPMWGVQFHPESIASEYGARLIENFAKLAGKVANGHGRGSRTLIPLTTPVPEVARSRATGRPWRLRHRQLDGEVDSAIAFRALFGDHPHAFWLDSSRAEAGMSRFSFLGAPDGPEDEVLRYRVDEGLVVQDRDGTRRETGTIFDALRDRLAVPVVGGEDLPFDLAGGYVGYFGYELKTLLGSASRHRSRLPDAYWISASRFIVVDHQEQRTYLVALCRSDDESAADTWLDETHHRLSSLPHQRLDDRLGPTAPERAADADPLPGLVRSRADYLADIAECQRELHAGESYEICLTTRFELSVSDEPLELYLLQRRSNPAPYAAFLRLGEMAVLCSSPERFLRIDRNRVVETKPIKGTIARSTDPVEDASLGAQLAKDPKTRAENLMIVDLLRNDLGRVCEIGSVNVPAYMAVESYATVHQLVSTVRGRLRADVDAIGCVQACFPGGSMTGAPKLRTMEIIDRLETTPRSVYSGALGFLSRNGTADLNIVIRTAVVHGEELTLGAGGAIVLDSDPVGEFDEMLLKAHAPVRGLAGRVRPPARRRHLREASR
jgi:para-aminobenzoate synthetase